MKLVFLHCLSIVLLFQTVVIKPRGISVEDLITQVINKNPITPWRLRSISAGEMCSYFRPIQSEDKRVNKVRLKLKSTSLDDRNDASIEVAATRSKILDTLPFFRVTYLLKIENMRKGLNSFCFNHQTVLINS
ncbi:hypothetical protein CAEBREN_30429 [Caenorhabditis brenneri]|uniref:Uncharacterized protein n=1 Tax=Caenorhabditis brenneri TaxID=135651 RepID=G0PBD8_CAEBE|nr:hypothetical protein CAEBREN_30429 [Caenorhabditis brenneri]